MATGVVADIAVAIALAVVVFVLVSITVVVTVAVAMVIRRVEGVVGVHQSILQFLVFTFQMSKLYTSKT
jgi:hypothetical protein